MSAMEKHVVQIFEKTKRIIDQSRQQCHLWEDHLFPKLLLNGIAPPPWLSNSSLRSQISDPQDLNNDDLVSEVLLSQPQLSVPFPGRHCSLYSNLDVVSDAIQYPIGLHNDSRALKKDCNMGNGLSNLPDCSVNDVGCASSGPPELDSGAISPQNQLEPRDLDSQFDPALSLAKLQRSKSRQRALELRNSAKAFKRWSGDDNNAGVCAGTLTGSASPIQQAEHIMESDLVKDFHSNVRSCSMEEMTRHDCVTQKDKSNFSGQKTRSKSSSQKFNSLNVASSSVEKEDGPPPYNLKSFEMVNQPCSLNESCGVKEANEGEYRCKEAGGSVYNNKRLTISRSSSQARYNGELLNLNSTLGSGEGVEACNLMLPFTHVEQTDLSKASDCNDESRRNTVKEGDFCHNKQESNISSRIRLLRSSCPSPGDDFLMTDCSVKSIDKSVQSPQLLISQNSQDPTASVVGSFSNQKDPDFCAIKTKERLSRSGSGKVYITQDSKLRNHAEDVLKSSRCNSCVQNATCSESAGKKSRDLWPTEMDAKRSSSSPKYSKLDREIAMNYAEKENISTLATSRNIRAVTTCANEGSLRPASSSNLDGRALLAESVHIEIDVGKKVLNTQENIFFGAIPTDNVEHITAATLGKVDADGDGLLEKDPCVSPKVGPNVSVMKLPSDFAMSVMPKQLDFDDAEEISMNGICSPDLKGGQQAMSPEEEPLNSLEPVNLLEEESSLVCQDKHNSSGEMHLLESQEVLISEEGLQMEKFASDFEKNIARTALNTMPPNKELSMVQKEFCIRRSSLRNHSRASLVVVENSSGSLLEDVMASKFVSVNNKQKNDDSCTRLADSSSEAVTGNGLHKYTDENVTDIPVGFPFAAPLDNVTVGLAQQAPNSISLCQAGDSLLGDAKVTGFSTDFQIFKSSTESFTYDVEISCPQQKRRKLGIETQKFLPASSNLSEKPLDSIDQRPKTRNLSIKEDSPEVALEDQLLASNQEDNAGNQFISDSPMEEMQHNGECQTMEVSSLKVRKEEKLILDGRDRSADIFLLAEANSSGFNINSTMQCTVDEKDESWHHQVNCGQESAEILTGVQRSTSSRIYPGENAEFSDAMSVSPGIQCLDLIDTDETLPEFEGFIMQTENAQPCIAGDQMELEKMNLQSNSIDYTSHGKSRFMHSPLCYSSTPYKLHNLPELYEPLPNGLLEGLGLRSSLPVKDGSPRSLSDCQPNCNAQYTSSVQTLWDRINSNFGSSGKCKSLKLELPCISEENENVDETAATFHGGIDSEAMTGSITTEPLAEIIDNASLLQDDIVTGGCEDTVSTEFKLSGTCNKVKNRLDKQDGNRRRFMSKGKENQNVSLGANGVKRTTESVRKRPGRLKLSGKDSMKQQGPTHSEVRSTCNNIVSNVSSFIPLVQQKQAAAAAFTGKRDIKVKALEAAEAAKRMAEKKENERKMKKEALKLEREKLELQNQKQLELQKKMKEEERKKKEAQMAAKKRQREEEEKREKERKRKRVNDVKKKEHEKIHAKKEEIEIQCRATDEEAQESNKFMDESENHKNSQVQDQRETNVEKISFTELANRDSANDKTKERSPEYSESVNDCANNGKVTDNLTKVTEDDDLIIKNLLQEQSYEISPYKGSDDEDEDEDDIPNNKFIPSWASKHSLSLIVSSQKMNPETIFPPQSFCNIAEVLLPRKLQLR